MAESTSLPVLAGRTIDELPKRATPLRVAFFARSKRRTRVPFHFARAFRDNGNVVAWFRSRKLASYLGEGLADRWLRSGLRRFRPDLVVSYAEDLPLGVQKEISDSVSTVVFYEDAGEAPAPAVVELARRSDLLVTTARGWIDRYRDAGVPRVEYLRSGCDPHEHHRTAEAPKYDSDIAFIGKCRAPNDRRSELMSKVADKFDLAIYGRHWASPLSERVREREVGVAGYRRVCASARIVLGIDYWSDLDLYFSNRTWLTLGCGGFLLTQYVPGLEEFFHNHEHLVWYHDFDECQSLIEEYLAKPEERARIATAGYEYVHRYHTFRHAAQEIVELAGVVSSP